jgi:L-histidine N-alpha-methyltransferase
MGPNDHLLLGTDLVKDPGRLVAAYDDQAGVTAEFNRNVLSVLNRELHATFDPDLFEHRAIWNDEHSRVEMRLRATRPHGVSIRDLNLTVTFKRDEEILTEISTKFTDERVFDELAAAGLRADASWLDAHGDFLLTMSAPTRSSRH